MKKTWRSRFFEYLEQHKDKDPYVLVREAEVFLLLPQTNIDTSKNEINQKQYEIKNSYNGLLLFFKDMVKDKKLLVYDLISSIKEENGKIIFTSRVKSI